MATDKTLALRAIRPHIRTSTHTPNAWRRATKAEARKLRISRRRLLKLDKRGTHRVPRQG